MQTAVVALSALALMLLAIYCIRPERFTFALKLTNLCEIRMVVESKKPPRKTTRR